MTAAEGTRIELSWLPLGAGGNFVRLNGRLYEAIMSRLERRPARDIYHAGLQVFVPEGRYVIEMTPAIGGDGRSRGVVAEGPVGARWAGRWRIFRYELRRWFEGVIPDLREAVDSPRVLSEDLGQARRLLELAPRVPRLVWGRDEAKAGEMWNSNSIIAWLLAGAGVDVGSIHPPAGGRAPGWNAGLVVADQDAYINEGRARADVAGSRRIQLSQASRARPSRMRSSPNSNSAA